MYKSLLLPFDSIPQFSDRDKAYQNADPRLRPFYQHEVSIESFDQVIAGREQLPVDRELLVNSLRQKYSTIEMSAATSANISSLLKADTYTIVTAHQPSLLTGPLYFIYKICSVISLAQRLNEGYPNKHIVPCFIMGGEDHDFDEIATLHLFGGDFTWETDQVGSTGRMKLDGLDEVLDAVQAKFGEGDHADRLREMIISAKNGASTYGQFMMSLVNSLFGEYGLVICNMDDADLKSVLLPYVIQDIKGSESEELVQKDQAGLEAAGFKSQAHARGVNIFWFNGDRHRVIKEDDNHYTINGTSYTQAALIDLLESDPGSISPNVILRPVYQEVALPNLAYIGGGGELAYWLERKSLFEAWGIPFPMLIRRDSVMIVDKRSSSFVEDAQLNITDLFDRVEQLEGKYAMLHAAAEIDFSKEREELKRVFDAMAAVAQKIDPTLEKTALSEEAKAQKSIDMLENKLLKAEKQKNEVAINKLTKVKQKFFPGNDGLQERYDNFIGFYLRHGQDWISTLIKHLDPMEKRFKVLIEE